MKGFFLSKKLFFFLVFFLPFSFALNLSADFDLAITRILIPLLFLIWLTEGFLNKKVIIDTRPRFIFLVLFLFLVCVSYFWADEKERAFRKILFLFSFIPIYFVAFDFFKNQKCLGKGFLFIFWSGLVVALGGIFQFLGQFIFSIDTMISLTEKINPFFLGNNFAKTVSLYPSWLVAIGDKTFLRAFFVFPDPHLFSLFLNLVLPIVLCLFFQTKKRLFLIGFFIILLSSFLSFSRAGLLALFLSFFVGLFIFGFVKNFFRKPLLLLPIIFGLFLLFFFPNPVRDRFLSSFNFEEGSVSERIILWQKSFEIGKENPLGGVGIGNFSLEMDAGADLRNPAYGHNLLLDFSAETGFPSALLLLFVLLCPIVLYFSKSKKRLLLDKFLFFSFFIFFIHCFFETPFYSVRVFPLFLILLAIKTDVLENK